jgi:hypothetical protein
LLAVALRGQVLGRDAEAVGERVGDGLRPAVGQRQVVDVGADGVRVTLD